MHACGPETFTSVIDLLIPEAEGQPQCLAGEGSLGRRPGPVLKEASLQAGVTLPQVSFQQWPLQGETPRPCPCSPALDPLVPLQGSGSPSVWGWAVSLVQV